MPNINLDDAYILDETGAQVDKVTGLFTKDEGTTSGEKAFAQLNIGTAGSNRNLLDNPWFTVNQRGITSGTSNEYPADRWVATYGAGGMTWVRNADGSITATPTNTSNHADIYQVLEQSLVTWLSGKTVTVSVLLADGTILSGTNMFSATGNRTFVSETVGSGRVDITWSYTNRFFRVQNYYAGTPIKAAKLELGSVSTLANDAPPEYAGELAKCQYYFRRWSSPSGSSAIGLALAVGTTNANFALLSSLRASGSATISFSGLVLSDGTDHAVTNVTVAGAGDGATMRLLLTSTDLTAYRAYTCQISAGGHLDVSKDL